MFDFLGALANNPMFRKRKNKNNPVVKVKKIQPIFFVSKELLALTGAVIILFLIVLVIVKDNRQSARISAHCQECAPVIAQSTTVNTNDLIEGTNAAKVKYWQSFGDNFSSLVYVDENQSNMFFDVKITSLIFPPVYSWTKRFACENINCLSAQDFFIPAKILPPNYDSLTHLNNQLSLLPKPLPKELEGREILSMSINKLNFRQVVSFVVREGKEERGLIYFLDGEKFTPIITDVQGAEILTFWGAAGGSIVAGGEDNDFLILYIGYEGKAWHYKDGALTDVSRFFGLRVANKGFHPFIIKQGRGNDTVWFVLSLTEGKSKLIKLWQNGTSRIQGGVDLSSQIEEKLSFVGGRLVGIRSGAEKGVVDFVVESPSGFYNLWSFQDFGFDNSFPRQVASKNVNSNNFPIFKAFIRDIGIATQGRGGGYEAIFPDRAFKIYLGDNPNNMSEVNPGQMIKFSGSERQLFWKIEFFPGGTKEYSPWFDHLNDLQYLATNEMLQ